MVKRHGLVDATKPLEAGDVSHLFEAIEGPESDDPLFLSAQDYFREQFFEHLRLKISYREDFSELLGNLSFEDAQSMAERHEEMMYRVICARQILELHSPNEIGAWLESSRKVRQAYKVVLTDKLVKSSDFRGAFFDESEVDFARDCHNTVQRLEGWLKSEIDSK